MKSVCTLSHEDLKCSAYGADRIMHDARVMLHTTLYTHHTQNTPKMCVLRTYFSRYLRTTADVD